MVQSAFSGSLLRVTLGESGLMRMEVTSVNELDELINLYEYKAEWMAKNGIKAGIRRTVVNKKIKEFSTTARYLKILKNKGGDI